MAEVVYYFYEKMQYAASLELARRNRIIFGRRYRLIIFLVFISLSTSAQTYGSRILEYDTESRAGSVWLTNGAQLDGKIVFNDNDGSVLLSLEEENEVKAFNARTLSKFKMYGSPGQPDQTFYALDYDDPETGFKKSGFFEVLKELKEFMVLMRIDPVKDGEKMRMIGHNERRSGFQRMTIYFIGADGELEPYVEYIRREKNGLLFDSESNRKKYIDPDLFKRYTSEHYPTLVEYARSKGIGFKRKEDVIDILNHYEKLINH